MKWEKQGLIYALSDNIGWMKTHTQLPIPFQLENGRLRIYFGSRDEHNRTLPTYLEVDSADLKNVLYVHDKPLMHIGEQGTFDDSGVMPSWIVERGGLLYLYYIGWNRGVTIAYHNSIGLAVSDDGGQTFTRMYKGPIVDRNHIEPHFCAAPCVIVENGLWRMWYLSCVKWTDYEGVPEPFYHIKYAESQDGIVWNRRGIVSIDFKFPDEAGIVRSSVLKHNGIYKMWYSYRSYKNYRKDSNHSYRIGYAESDDGISWERLDDIGGLDTSEDGWDSIMTAYPYVFRHNGKILMLYNGNGFGQSGFGYAELVEPTE